MDFPRYMNLSDKQNKFLEQILPDSDPSDVDNEGEVLYEDNSHQIIEYDPI